MDRRRRSGLCRLQTLVLLTVLLRLLLPDPEEVEYPSILRITSLPAEQAQAEAIQRADRWQDGDEVPHVVNFEDRSRLRKLLTDRRMELIEEVMESQPDSIRGLADRLDRDVRDVHDDLHLLAEYNIIHFRTDGRSKRPTIPYDIIRLEVEFGVSKGGSSESPASV